ncbi:MAG TPA: isoprenyl transferase [Fibrobacteres bacterium]|jgi:undecaprenyl diphosphate synthase|nr:isoprenyl transferase [Fibrobacterota bacterium]
MREPLPKHIAVIMDGNGRWARKRLQPRLMGHRAGTKATRRIVEACGEIGIQYLTIYVFSSENWARPILEVNALMDLLVEMIHQEVEDLMKNNVRLQALGNLSKLPPRTLEELKWGIEKTKNNTGLTLNLAVSYGGREEIVDACRRMAEEARAGKLDPASIDEATLSQHLYLPNVPDPELLIRTGGDVRISNFLLWQIAYTELYVTPTLWPDFGKEELVKAIEAYQGRERRFGKVLEG